MVIPPRDSAELKMTIKPNTSLGKWNIQCTIETDDADEPSRTYTVSYRSYPHVRFDESTLDLGPVTSDGAGLPGSGNKETWCEIFEPTSSRIDAPTDIEAPSCLAVDLDRVPVVDFFEDGAITRCRYRLGVRYTPGTSQFDGASGTHSATIAATTRQGHAASITALWSFALPVQASPASLSFGLVRAASGTLRRDLTLEALDGRPFRILAIDSDSQSVEPDGNAGTEPIISAGLSHSLGICYRNKIAGNRYETGKLVIATDHPEMPKITIRWSAIHRE